MLRFSLVVIRKDRIRNENIRGRDHVEQFGDKVTDKVEMVWTYKEEGK